MKRRTLPGDKRLITMEDKSIQLGQGAGGELMQELLKKTLLPRIRRNDGSTDHSLPPALLDDSAAIDEMALTIDGHTIWPLEFPGGDIGSLSVCGTVNDLAVVGAVPQALALSMVIEEGLSMEVLERISRSIGDMADRSGTDVITGDTKVVERGGVKGMIVTTAGIGRRHDDLMNCIKTSRANGLKRPKDQSWLRDDSIRPTDQIILTGSLGDHGISLLSFREGYGFDTDLESDLAPLNSLMDSVIKAGGIPAAKDLTRGGLANGLNEWSSKSGFGIEIEEESIPIKPQVLSACDMLGLDPFEIGNEGKAIIAVSDGMEEDVLSIVRKHPLGKDSEIIGKVVEGKARVVLRTIIGGKRIMDAPYGDPVPRIC
jgi:hydrogenase expression/formation protein HypE